MFAPLLFLTLTPLTHALCTFPLHQRHDPPKTHILLHSITDRAHNLVIDVGSHRPPTAWNTYSLLDETHHFAVAGLLDDTRLTIKRDGEDGALAFDVGGVQWSSEGRRGDAAGCETGEWVEGAGGRRERRLDCWFPCEVDEGEGEDDGKGEDGFGAWEGGRNEQVGIEL